MQIQFINSCGGNRHFLETVAIPLCQGVEDDLPEGLACHNGNRPPCLQTEPRPRNDGLIFAGVVGFVFFVASWAAKKTLDELYTIKLRPKLALLFSKIDSEISKQRIKVFQLGVWYEEEQKLVLLFVIGDTYTEILNNDRMIKTVHGNAIRFMMDNNTEKPVHAYFIDNGVVNVEPMLFDKADHVHEYLGSIYRITFLDAKSDNAS